MPSKLAIAKQLAKEKQLARQNARIGNLTKKKRKSGASEESPRKKKTLKPSVKVKTSPKSTSNKKRSRSLVNAAIEAAKKKNRTKLAESKPLATSATQIARQKARAAAKQRQSGVSSPKKRSPSTPKRRKPELEPIEIEDDDGWTPSTPKFEGGSEDERIGTPTSTVKVIDFEDLSEKGHSEYSSEEEETEDAEDVRSKQAERTVPKTKPTNRIEQKKQITVVQKARFMLVVAVLSFAVFLVGIVAVDYLIGVESMPAIAGPKLLELPSSAHSLQVSEILDQSGEAFEGWSQESLRELRNMYSSLPKAKQDDLFAKSIYDLSLAVHEMQQTNRWLKYGATFVG